MAVEESLRQPIGAENKLIEFGCPFIVAEIAFFVLDMLTGSY